MNDDWITDEGYTGKHGRGDFVRIVKYTHFTPSQGNEPRCAVYLSTEATRRIGDTKFVQFLMNTSQEKAMVRITPCGQYDKGAKRISTKAKTQRISGGERIINKHKMPQGHYMYDPKRNAYVLNEDD